MKTKAVVFPEADRYEVWDMTPGALGPTDVGVRTLVTAISPGTERWTLRGKHIGTSFPCIPGYHRIGVVEECGAAVRNVQVGDIVYGSAGKWEESIYSLYGAHCGYTVGPAAGYSFVAASRPPTLELECLAFTIVAGVGHRGIRFLEVGQHDRIAIIGGGFIGLCAAQLALFRRATPIIIEKDPDRLAFAAGMLPFVYSVDDPELAAKVGTVDMVYDTVGHAPTTDRLVQQIRPQGKLLLQAQYFDKEKCAIDLDQVKIHELTVKTTCGVDTEDRRATMGFIRDRTLQIHAMITHRFPAADILEGYRLLDKGTPFNMGIVFHWENLDG